MWGFERKSFFPGKRGAGLRGGGLMHAVRVAALVGALAELGGASASSHHAADMVKLVLVGDSTMAATSGWGGAFCSLHTLASVACVNLAQGGRSTASFRNEGFWDLALAEVHTKGYRNCYVLIELGQNDTSADVKHHTDLGTEFPRNLERFIDEVRTAGGIPVLLTPIAGRRFVNFRLINAINPWANQVRAVASRKNVPLVDINASSAKLFQELGPERSLDFEVLAPTEADIAEARSGTSTPYVPSTPPPKNNEPGRYTADYIHLNRKGAEALASLVASGLVEVVPELRSGIRD